MAYREFLDSKGQSWRVWSTVPSSSSRLRGGFDQGWLTFERISAETTLPLRRLVPLPTGWEAASEQELEQMCRLADEVARPGGGRDKSTSGEAAPRD